MTLPELALTALQHFYRTCQPLPLPPDLPANYYQKAAVFVTLHNPDGSLRGCIGTLTPTKTTLAAEVIANAILAATQDSRFMPIQASDLPHVTASVDVLSPPVPVLDLKQLDPRRYGIIVSASKGRSGVLLPDLEGIDTVEEQIAMCRQKAGINPDEMVTLQQFEVERYN